jgi:hypothetical protein
MKIIAHRGLVSGPSDLENTPEQILSALDLGFDCEIDLRVIDDSFYLGHDYAQYKIDYKFLETPGLWIHAKNFTAMEWLSKTDLVYFWHQEDDCALTSNRYVWIYPGKPLLKNSIAVMPEKCNYTSEDLRKCFAICTDYSHAYQVKFNEENLD